MKYKYKSFKLLFSTIKTKLFGLPSYQRWEDLNNYDPQWDQRTILLSKHIPPNSRIIEFGAGRQILKKYLDPSCTYFPADLVSRGIGSIVCNLNLRPLPDLSQYNPEVAVFSGVIEYINDLPSLTDWLANQFSTCILSYVCLSSPPYSLKRLREIYRRLAHSGWVNNFDDQKLKSIFKQANFRSCQYILEKTTYGVEHIFIFTK